ncbi:MAG: ATP-binding cassette domain-containing protein, partial [Halioglobus sp.]|nr:ATP-binding cassette domain-containing protein [Halioglobus sp.]
MTQAASLRLEKVRLGLDGRTLLDLDCTVAPGEILTLMGPSGSGKSSLLAFVAGFLPPAFEAYGHVWLNGDEITALPAERRRVGLMFQDPLLFPHMSVGANLAFALSREAAKPKPERARLVEEALAEAGLAGFSDRDPATLSGGQQSRVALMRVLL